MKRTHPCKTNFKTIVLNDKMRRTNRSASFTQTNRHMHNIIQFRTAKLPKQKRNLNFKRNRVKAQNTQCVIDIGLSDNDNSNKTMRSADESLNK
jgi:hypothetical protein